MCKLTSEEGSSKELYRRLDIRLVIVLRFCHNNYDFFYLQSIYMPVLHTRRPGISKTLGFAVFKFDMNSWDGNIYVVNCKNIEAAAIASKITNYFCFCPNTLN